MVLSKLKRQEAEKLNLTAYRMWPKRQINLKLVPGIHISGQLETFGSKILLSGIAISTIVCTFV